MNPPVDEDRISTRTPLLQACQLGGLKIPCTPVRLLLILAIGVFIWNGAVQYVFHVYLSGMPLRMHGILSSVILSVAIFPILYWLVFLPLVREIRRNEELVKQLQRTHDQLLQAQKLEAAGRLAGGVAHDFNNLLTAIIGFSELVRKKLPPDSDQLQDVEEIRKAAFHGAELIRKLLAFTRRQVLTPRVVDLNSLIRDSERLFGRLIGEDITLNLDLEPAVGRIRIDPLSLEQVLMNLVVNARDAMQGGGTLTLQSRSVSFGGSSPVGKDILARGSYAVLSVRDTGCGMDDEILRHLFEPFFTTKQIGTGTGLGLSTVYGIVKQSGGAISVESIPDDGSTFSIFFPVVESGAPVSERRAAPDPSGGTETLLLVEDEEQVRRAIRTILESRGFTVLEASGGGEAFVAAQQHPEKIDLLLTDVVMPRMSGLELARRISPLRPDMKMLFMSGYLDRSPETGVPEIDEGNFIQKPFSEADLLSQIHRVLRAPIRQANHPS